jgi:hypothetical protein
LDGTILLSQFCGYEEGFAWFRGPSDKLGNVTANCRSMLESMPGTASDDPDVIKARVPIDHQMAVGAVLVLTHPRFTQWGLGQRRESSSQESTRRLFSGRARTAIRRIGIHWRSMRIVRYLEAAAFKAWKAIERQVSPDRKVTGGAGLHREKENLLSGDK